MTYAGFWRRFGAFWLDFVVLLPLTALALIGDTQSRLFGLWYQVYLVTRHGGTPGKLMLNLRIAMVDGSPVTPRAAFLRVVVLLVLTELVVIALIMASLRMTDDEWFSLGYMSRGNRLAELAPSWYYPVSIGLQIWMWSEYITMMFNKKRRAVHDFIAGTVVVKGRRPSSFMPPTGRPWPGSVLRRVYGGGRG